MRRRRSPGIFCARVQRRREAHLRAHKQRDDPPHPTAMDTLRDSVSRFRWVLFSLGVIVLASALIMGIAQKNTTPSSNAEEMSFLAQSDAAMTKMMATMQIKSSNNVDKDFVAMMVPHHQGAIDMAKAELRYGRNEPLRRLAQGIIVSQQGDIALMKLDLGGIASSSDPLDMAFLAQSDAAMTRMMAAMQIKPSHTVDKDFVAMMVPHHQGAIDMAKAEL
ncbi:MAG TPA: DUF305 domain-containing protein, partial [Ktedonobacteraceae bacterium]|nr:DUF305 domain-containing protein [Ktedonobacteraceae bacterium]